MAYTPHVPVKPTTIVEATTGLVEKELTIAKLVTRKAFDAFKGEAGDKVTIKVRGRLPYRQMDFRDDRTNSLVTDIYKEGKTDITWGGYIYSGVAITDEQAQFDLDGWTALVDEQASAVAAGINREAANLVTGAPYEVVIKGAKTNLRSATGEARKVLNKFGVPNEGRILIVGSDFEQAMLEEKGLTLASYVGDVRADTALGQSILGRINGFTVVLDLTIGAADAYAMVPSGFVQLLGPPLLPQSVPFGATLNKGGVSLRWMRDYWTEKRTDRSFVDTWEGHNHVLDAFLPERVLATTDPHTAFDPNTLKRYFVRGVKLELNGLVADSIYPAHAVGQKSPSHGTAAGTADAAEVARVADLRAWTGVSSQGKWVPAAL